MSYVCDQDCVFCSESARMERYKKNPISYANIVKTLIRKRQEGCDHVTFTGGEPTIYPRFPDILKAAKRLGFKTYATSDGQRLGESNYAAQTLPWLDELCISIHGPDEATHDHLVKKIGSFGNIMRCFSNIAKAERRPYLLTNTVMTRQNFHCLEDTVRMLSQFSIIRHYTISNLAPDGGALIHYKQLAPQLEEIRRIAPILAHIANAKGVVLRFFGVPLCILPADPKLSNDLNWDPRVTVERGDVEGRVGLQEIHSHNPGRMRIFPKECADCSAKRHCWGIFETYHNHFGGAELRPILVYAAVNSPMVS